MSKKLRLPFVRKSTQAYIDEARKLEGFTLWDWLHGYFYAVFPYTYIGNGIGEKPLGKAYRWIDARWKKVFPPRPKAPPPAGERKISFPDTYHGKVVPLQTARQLVTVKEDIAVSYPEKVIPYLLARDLILQDPDHIALLDCPCRASRPNPCLPMDVCLIIGEPFAGMVIEHHPRRSRWITPERALEVLEEEEKRGHVHHAFFKEVVLRRFYAICNCCACCCGAMQAQREGTPMLASSGYLSRVDDSQCIGCAACQEICPFDAVRLVDGLPHIDESRCMGCGICVSHCPEQALSLELAPQKGDPLTLPA